MTKIKIKKFDGKMSQRRYNHIRKEAIDLKGIIARPRIIEKQRQNFLSILKFIGIGFAIIGVFLIFQNTNAEEPKRDIITIEELKENHIKYIQSKEPVRKSYKEFMAEGERIHKLRYKEQDWKDNTINIIKKYEGLRLSSYCDKLIYRNGRYLRACYTGKERYSIGYGSTSYKGEKITEKEANLRLAKYLNNNIFDEINLLTCWNNNQKTAIADFMYNSGKYTKHNITGKTFLHYVKRCDKGTIAQFIYPGNYRQKGLKKRRNAEWFYFTKK